MALRRSILALNYLNQAFTLKTPGRVSSWVQVLSPRGDRGSTPLKGEQFCCFQQNAIRSVRRPKQSRLHPIALIEDEESIQYALMEVINALMKNTIDLKRATLILRALHIAVKNAARVKFAIQSKNAVSQSTVSPHPWTTPTSMRPLKSISPTTPGSRKNLSVKLWKKKPASKNCKTGKPNKPRIGADLERARTDVPTCVGADASVRPAREASVPSASAEGKPKPCATAPDHVGAAARNPSLRPQASASSSYGSEAAQESSPQRKAWITCALV